MTTAIPPFPGAELLDQHQAIQLMKSVARNGRRIMPPVKCYSFCVYGDGHPGETSTSDQNCYGKEHKIPTTYYPPVEYGENEWEQCYFTVYARWPHDGEQPTIVLGLEENEGLHMHLDEARAVAIAILAAADDIDASKTEGALIR